MELTGEDYSKQISSYRTYEEWKQRMVVHQGIHEGEFLPYL